jgi:carbonic anhydrase/acetyltransferase-like protein (isoleucine patch superfamily)
MEDAMHDAAALARLRARHPGAIIDAYQGVIPEIAEDVFIAPGAAVIGRVRLGPRVGVWYGCVLRGDDHHIHIGAGSNVQDGTVIHVTLDQHPTEVGEGVTIGHGVRLHGCRLEDRCLVGIGAIVLDGAVVESDSFVAAGAVVAPGKRILSGQLWAGNPARMLRELRPGEREFLPWNAAHYAGLAARYRDAGT